MGHATHENLLPGAPPLSAALQARLRAARAAKGEDYVPRTRHRWPDGEPKYTNRLLLRSSPYLQQHAHNPVNWYPWSEEAFAQAQRENKPVLLSVGYATCHWCHVMEEESFEDEEIAAYLNQHYIAIKVDREQRPDIDGVYMAAVQMLTGSGGWPMTVWLTPERKPFYGGTYFPPRDGGRGRGAGFLTVLQRLDEIYHRRPEDVARAAGDLAARIRASVAPRGAAVSVAGGRALHAAIDTYRRSFDPRYGGFGQAPKFPPSAALELLLRYYRRTGERDALEMVTKTLTAMAAGGIYDHVGGGFHRYATDARWRVPHFEKMLYDNALLVVTYLEAYQATGREDFAGVARAILRYVTREMTAPAGAFFSATDADSEGEEGKFFLWSRAEIAAVLGADRARWFANLYGVTAAGNFEGKNILYLARPSDQVAGEAGMDNAAFRAAVERARDDLYEARRRRPPPLTDTKILVSWNGLMISALARAAQVLGEAAYAAQAGRAAEFILSRMRAGQRLRRSYVGGRAAGAGFLDDYAFLAQGLLDLYEADFNPRWLREAVALHAVLEQHFADREHGGYFLTPDDGEVLLARKKPTYDGAEPSGNSVATLNLLRLAEFTSDDRYRASADEAIGALAETLERSPTALPKTLAAIDFRLDTPKEIVLVKPDSDADIDPFLAPLRALFLPNRVLAVVTSGAEQEGLRRLLPLVADRPARGERVTAYVCERQVCQLPTTDPKTFARQLAKVEPLDGRGAQPARIEKP